ncbi:MAG: glycoside hydrolase family 3 C-terminal domain-containing protein [Lachnospiraceae bacterium]|nr:glycoside hydrolase family 3 C-terminal domain-containing protein [Lachnospiraceae bacterium]
MTREEARKKAIELVSQMTTEEKAGQLRYDAPAIERLDIPAYNWWNECLHGVARAGTATVFPQAIGLAAMFDEEFLGEIADAISTEARAKYNAYSDEEDRDIYKGLTMWSPNVNIFRDPRWGRGHETYGEDPFLSGKLGTAFVKGLQGNGDHMKVAACAKHFAVHSGPEALRHSFDARCSKKDMFETYLPAFETLVKDAKVEAVMGAYNRVDGEPACAQKFLMEDILRGEWGFEGHYVSDCWAIRDFHENHKVTKNSTESAALALNTGCDVNCGCTYEYILDALREGLITEEAIDRSVIRLFTTRFLLGMFEPCEYDSIDYSEVESKEHIKLAKKAARKSVVLLKNDGILPLDSSKLKSIGVIGPNANSRASLIGNYHGTASRYVTVLEGIQKIADKNDIRVHYSDGSHLFKERVENLAFDDDRMSEAVIVAKNSDVVVLVVGLDEGLEGEEGDTGNSYASGDKETLNLPEPQMRMIEAVASVGTPIILVNMTGSAMDMSYAKDNDVFGAILQTWYPGCMGGKAVAEILFGKVSPSGKLPVTFYNSLDELPAFEDYSMKGRTYKYIENKAQYPFGYGLTYAKVEMTKASLADEEKAKAVITSDDVYTGNITVKTSIKNTSKVKTDEVIEIYIKNHDSQFAVRNHSLCGFKRVTLNPGAEKNVEIVIPSKVFMSVNDEGKYIMDGKNYTLYVGVSQPDEVSTSLCGIKPLEININL